MRVCVCARALWFPTVVSPHLVYIFEMLDRGAINKDQVVFRESIRVEGDGQQRASISSRELSQADVWLPQAP